MSRTTVREATFSTSGTSDGIDRTLVKPKVRRNSCNGTRLSAMEKKLETKLKQLKLSVERTNNILDSGKPESIKRHLSALRETVREANECKRAVESEKIETDESAEIINDWNIEVETKIERADDSVNCLENWLSERKRTDDNVAQEEQFKIELKLHEKRMKMKAELELTKTTPEVQKCSDFKTAKLPKLVISKFDGSFMDWQRFWGQFCEAINKSSIAPCQSPSSRICVSYYVQRLNVV